MTTDLSKRRFLIAAAGLAAAAALGCGEEAQAPANPPPPDPKVPAGPPTAFQKGAAKK